jgi:hypothetical protein
MLSLTLSNQEPRSRNAQVAAYHATQHKKLGGTARTVNSIRIKKEFPDDDSDNRFVCPSDSASSIVSTSHSAVAVRSEAVIAAETDRKHNAWAKVHMAKAIEENANVAKKMAEFDAIEKKLMLLERMRGVMGEADYTARVKELLDTMPDTKLFAKQCEVVCIGEEGTSDAEAANNEASNKKKIEVVCIDEDEDVSKVVEDESILKSNDDMIK